MGLLAFLTPLAASAAGSDDALSNGSTLFFLVSVVMGFGALGGFVDGLTTNITYRVNFGSRSLNIGSLGDALAGSTAALAIFTVGTALFPEVKLHDFGSNIDHSIRVIAISVLSGYAGVRLLNPLTRKLVEQISADKAHEATRAFKGRSEELTINVKDGERQLYRFDSEQEALVREGKMEKANELLDAAGKSFEVAVKIDPLDTEALMGMAKIARRRAQLHEAAGQNAEDHWNEAIQLLDRITSNNPKAARAYYNKACYKQARQKDGNPSAEALRDLKAALDLQPGLKRRAATDHDFTAICGAEEFKALVK